MHGDSRDLPNKTNHMCFMHTHHEENVKNLMFFLFGHDSRFILMKPTNY